MQGCVVCTQRRWAADGWVHGFVDAAEVRPALGLCAAHMRRLLADATTVPLRTPLLAQEITNASRRLRRGKRAAQHGSCPLCSTERGAQDAFVHRIVGGLRARRADLQELETVQLCTEHTGVAIRRAASGLGPSPTAKAGIIVMAEGLRHALHAAVESPGTPWAVAITSRADEDAPHRAAWWGAVDAVSKCQQLAADVGVLERLQALLDGQNCPPCAAAAAAGQDYLGWLAERPADGEEADLLLCARHLHDVARGDSVGSWIVRQNARFWDRRLAGFVAAMKGRRASRVAMRRLVAGLVRPIECAACRAERTAVRQTWELLQAATLDRWTRDLIDASHGVCLIHAAELPAGDAFRSRLRARVALTEWELREALRHAGRDGRHEYQGAELHAWVRAPTLLDGAIYCGCAAPAAGDTPTGVIMEPIR